MDEINDQSAAGLLYEVYCHRKLSLGGKFEIERILPQHEITNTTNNENCKFILSFVTKWLDLKSPLQLRARRKEGEALSRCDNHLLKEQLSYLEEDKYYIPDISNFKLVDSFVKENGILIGFNATVGKTHELSIDAVNEFNEVLLYNQISNSL